MKKKVILISVFLMYSCYDDQNLGNNYFYLPMYEAYDIGYEGSIIYKSHKKLLFSDIII